MSDARIDAVVKVLHEINGLADDDDWEQMTAEAVVLVIDEVSASECEKLRAALAALVERDERDEMYQPECYCEELVAARALVGSVPPNEADE